MDGRDTKLRGDFQRKPQSSSHARKNPNGPAISAHALSDLRLWLVVHFSPSLGEKLQMNFVLPGIGTGGSGTSPQT